MTRPKQELTLGLQGFTEFLKSLLHTAGGGRTYQPSSEKGEAQDPYTNKQHVSKTLFISALAVTGTLPSQSSSQVARAATLPIRKRGERGSLNIYPSLGSQKLTLKSGKWPLPGQKVRLTAKRSSYPTATPTGQQPASAGKAETQGQCDAQPPNCVCSPCDTHSQKSHSCQCVRQGRQPTSTIRHPHPSFLPLTDLVHKRRLAYASTSVNETAG